MQKFRKRISQRFRHHHLGGQDIEDDELQLDLIDEMSPGVLRGTGAFLYVLMPMRVTT